MSTVAYALAAILSMLLPLVLPAAYAMVLHPVATRDITVGPPSTMLRDFGITLQTDRAKTYYKSYEPEQNLLNMTLGGKYYCDDQGRVKVLYDRTLDGQVTGYYDNEELARSPDFSVYPSDDLLKISFGKKVILIKSLLPPTTTAASLWDFRSVIRLDDQINCNDFSEGMTFEVKSAALHYEQSGIKWSVDSANLATGQARFGGMDTAVFRTVVSDGPVPAQNLSKINSMEETQKRIKDSGFDLAIELREGGITFKVINKSGQDRTIDVDAWKIGASRTAFDLGSRQSDFISFEGDRQDVIPSNGSKVLADLDFRKTGSLQFYPGTYQVYIEGHNLEDHKKFEELQEQGQHFSNQELASYLLIVDLVMGFDMEKIQAQENRVLMATENVQVIIESKKRPASVSDIFVATEDDPKRMIVSIVNRQDYPVSTMLQLPSLSIYYAATAESTGVGGIADYFTNVCHDVLEPRESISQAGMAGFSGVQSSPFISGPNGLSMKHWGSETAKEGIYVVYLSGSAQGCMTEEGQEISGYGWAAAVAFELR